MYSLKGLYLTVLEPITYKQTERAIYIGDLIFILYYLAFVSLVIPLVIFQETNKISELGKHYGSKTADKEAGKKFVQHTVYHKKLRKLNLI